jgi:hypothetical protein
LPIRETNDSFPSQCAAGVRAAAMRRGWDPSLRARQPCGVAAQPAWGYCLRHTVGIDPFPINVIEVGETMQARRQGAASRQRPQVARWRRSAERRI